MDENGIKSVYKFGIHLNGTNTIENHGSIGHHWMVQNYWLSLSLGCRKENAFNECDTKTYGLDQIQISIL